MSSESLPDLDDECFFIAPIGPEGSDTRERSDGVMEYIVSPAARVVELTVVRADKIAKPGEITRQVIEHVVGAKAAVVDLTGGNQNVYYEMAVRHTAQLPTVLIAQEGETLPFDIAQMRTIFFDSTSLKSAAECGEQISTYLREALAGEVDSPIAASVNVQRLEQGTPQERVLAQVVDGLDDLRIRMQMLYDGIAPGMAHRIPDAAVADLVESSYELAQLAAVNVPRAETLKVLNGLVRPLAYLADEYETPVGRGQIAVLRKHIGDLKRSLTEDAHEDRIDRLERLEAASSERGEPMPAAAEVLPTDLPPS